MNKQEQSELCRLLGKLRYDIMDSIQGATNGEFIESQSKLIEAINLILTYSYIDGNSK